MVIFLISVMRISGIDVHLTPKTKFTSTVLTTFIQWFMVQIIENIFRKTPFSNGNSTPQRQNTCIF